MSIGAQTNTTTVNAQLAQLAINLRNDLQACTNFYQWCVSEGTAGLEAIGFDSTDAGSLTTMASYMRKYSVIGWDGMVQARPC